MIWIFRANPRPHALERPAYEVPDTDIPMESLWGRQRTADLREQLVERSDPDAQLDAIETVAGL